MERRILMRLYFEFGGCEKDFETLNLTCLWLGFRFNFWYSKSFFFFFLPWILESKLIVDESYEYRTCQTVSGCSERKISSPVSQLQFTIKKNSHMDPLFFNGWRPLTDFQAWLGWCKTNTAVNEWVDFLPSGRP